MSSGSPIKPGRSNIAYSGHKVQRTEGKQFYERRNTAGAGPDGTFVKRSSSVQQSKPREVSNVMAKTAPQGFYKPQQHDNVYE